MAAIIDFAVAKRARLIEHDSQPAAMGIYVRQAETKSGKPVFKGPKGYRLIWRKGQWTLEGEYLFQYDATDGLTWRNRNGDRRLLKFELIERVSLARPPGQIDNSEPPGFNSNQTTPRPRKPSSDSSRINGIPLKKDPSFQTNTMSSRAGKLERVPSRRSSTPKDPSSPTRNSMSSSRASAPTRTSIPAATRNPVPMVANTRNNKPTQSLATPTQSLTSRSLRDHLEARNQLDSTLAATTANNSVAKPPTHFRRELVEVPSAKLNSDSPIRDESSHYRRRGRTPDSAESFSSSLPQSPKSPSPAKIIQASTPRKIIQELNVSPVTRNKPSPPLEVSKSLTDSPWFPYLGDKKPLDRNYNNHKRPPPPASPPNSSKSQDKIQEAIRDFKAKLATANQTILRLRAEKETAEKRALDIKEEHEKISRKKDGEIKALNQRLLSMKLEMKALKETHKRKIAVTEKKKTAAITTTNPLLFSEAMAHQPIHFASPIASHHSPPISTLRPTAPEFTIPVGFNSIPYESVPYETAPVENIYEESYDGPYSTFAPPQPMRKTRGRPRGGPIKHMFTRDPVMRRKSKFYTPVPVETSSARRLPSKGSSHFNGPVGGHMNPPRRHLSKNKYSPLHHSPGHNHSSSNHHVMVDDASGPTKRHLMDKGTKELPPPSKPSQQRSNLSFNPYARK